MVTAVAILAALLAITSPGAEAPEARALRLARAAIAIEQVSASQPWLAPALVATIRSESRGDLEVHAGRRVSSAGAVCLTQIHRGNRLRAWELNELVGTDYAATLRCVHVAAVTLVVSRAHCRKQRYLKNWAPAMFSVYVTGGKCWTAKDRFARAATMYRVVGTAWATNDEMNAAITAARAEAERTEAIAPEGFGPSAGAETSAKESDDDSNAQQEGEAEATTGESASGGSRARPLAGVGAAVLAVDCERDVTAGRSARVSSGDCLRIAAESGPDFSKARGPSDVATCARAPRESKNRRATRSLRSSGWAPVSDRTVAMRRWSYSLLPLPDGAIRIRDFGKREVLARREPHCDEERGWHKGVSLYVRRQ